MTCKTCGACKPLYICIHWGFYRKKQLYCTASETLTEGISMICTSTSKTCNPRF